MSPSVSRIGGSRSRVAAAAAAAGLALLSSGVTVNAEKYVFENERLPHAKTLLVLHGFSVFHEELDASSANDVQSVLNEKASVTFNQYMIDGVEKGTTLDGLQITVMKADDFHASVKKDHFCCSDKDVEDKLCTQKDTLMVTSAGANLLMKPEEIYSSSITSAMPSISTVIGAPTSHSKSYPLKSDGMYYLLVSNCGGKSYGDHAVLNGIVTVKADHGFLPSMYYYSMLTTGYAVFFYSS